MADGLEELNRKLGLMQETLHINYQGKLSKIEQLGYDVLLSSLAGCAQQLKRIADAQEVIAGAAERKPRSIGYYFDAANGNLARNRYSEEIYPAALQFCIGKLQEEARGNLRHAPDLTRVYTTDGLQKKFEVYLLDLYISLQDKPSILEEEKGREQVALTLINQLASAGLWDE